MGFWTKLILLLTLVIIKRWAQQWDNIESIVKPFDDTPILDVTEAMIEQVSTILGGVKLTVLDLSFFQSGLDFEILMLPTCRNK